MRPGWGAFGDFLGGGKEERRVERRVGGRKGGKEGGKEGRKEGRREEREEGRVKKGGEGSTGHSGSLARGQGW